MGKLHNIGGLATIKNLIAPLNRVAAASYSLEGVSIDREDFDSALIAVRTGTATGTPDSLTVDAKLQDSADGSSWADVAADAQNPSVAITQITAVSQNRFLEVNLQGLRRYVRLVFTVAFSGGTTPAVGLSAEAVLMPVVGPPTHA